MCILSSSGSIHYVTKLSLLAQDQKKNVSFKKQKYHCVYEYPRETSDSDSEGFDSPTRRHWNNLVYQSTQPQVDYASFAGQLCDYINPLYK
jgi:hypothetical protein